MTKLNFLCFMDCEDGKIARVETTDGENAGIPVNIFIDNADKYENAQEGPCAIEIYGVGSDIQIFSSEEDYYKIEGNGMVPVSMIPMGTFPVNDQSEDFEQSPYILFSGKALDVKWDPSAKPNEVNCNIAVETFGFTFTLCLHYEGKVGVGNIVRGVAWLFGDMVMGE